MQHFVDARGYRFHILEDDDFYLIYNPIAKILPDSVDEDEVDSELEEVQTRFAELLPGLVNGTETTLSGEFGDYYFPGHFQKLRLMYMYFQNLGFLCPETAEALVESLRPLGNRWFAEAEFEGAEAPELWGTFFCHKNDFYFQTEFGNRYAKMLCRKPVTPIQWKAMPLDFPTT